MAEMKVIELPVPAMVDKSPLMNVPWGRLLPANMTAGGVSHVAPGESPDEAWLCSDLDGVARRMWTRPDGNWAASGDELRPFDNGDIRPVNGIAFSDCWAATSSTTGLTVQYKPSAVRRLIDQGVPVKTAIRTMGTDEGTGCHDVLAGSRGRFYAPCFGPGVMVLQASLRGEPGSERVDYRSFDTCGYSPYRLCKVNSLAWSETIAVACRKGGVRFMTFPAGDDYANHTVARLVEPEIDCVDVTLLPYCSGRVLALNSNGDVWVVQLDGPLARLNGRLLSDAEDRAYSIHRAGQHLVVMTNKAIKVYVDAVKRLSDTPHSLLSGNLLGRVLTIPIEAVHAAVIHDQHLMVATADGRVWLLDINLLVSLNR